MKYRNLILKEVKTGNILHDMKMAIMIALVDGKWQCVADVLVKAKIKPDSPLIFSTLLSLKNQGFAEIHGDISNDKEFANNVTIGLTQKGIHHIKKNAR